MERKRSSAFGESVNTLDRGHYLTSVGVLKPCTLFSLYSGGIVFPFSFPGSGPFGLTYSLSSAG